MNRSSVIALLMPPVLAAGLVGLKADWDYWILFIEAGVLAPFLTFWILQSLDLWNRRTVRPATSARYCRSDSRPNALRGTSRVGL